MAGLFEHVLVPVDSPADARATCSRLRDHVDPADQLVTVVHVIKHKPGGISRAPMDARRQDSEALFEAVRTEYGDLVHATELAYGRDVAAAILDVARDVEASAIVFTPHDEGRLVRWLSGDVALSIISRAEIPVIAFPHGIGASDA